MSNKMIEDTINNVLKGDAHKNALDFVTYLGSNEITLEDSEFCWTAKYKDENVCYIKIGGFDNVSNSWIIWSADDYNDEYDDSLASDDIKEFAWKHICFCGSCGGECTPGRSTTIFGKKYDKVCQSAMMFIDLDFEATNLLKKLIDIRVYKLQKQKQLAINL